MDGGGASSQVPQRPGASPCLGSSRGFCGRARATEWEFGLQLLTERTELTLWYDPALLWVKVEEIGAEGMGEAARYDAELHSVGSAMPQGGGAGDITLSYTYVALMIGPVAVVRDDGTWVSMSSMHVALA